MRATTMINSEAVSICASRDLRLALVPETATANCATYLIALASAWARAVDSQVKSSSGRPKWPYAAVWL
jgi:hypothetical protein